MNFKSILLIIIAGFVSSIIAWVGVDAMLISLSIEIVKGSDILIQMFIFAIAALLTIYGYIKQIEELAEGGFFYCIGYIIGIIFMASA